MEDVCSCFVNVPWVSESGENVELFSLRVVAFIVLVAVLVIVVFGLNFEVDVGEEVRASMVGVDMEDVLLGKQVELDMEDINVDLSEAS